MLPKVSKVTDFKENISSAAIFKTDDQFPAGFLTKNESEYFQNKTKKDKECVVYIHPVFKALFKIEEKPEFHFEKEAARAAGAQLFDVVKKEKTETILLNNFSEKELMIDFLEGFLLASYSFDKYKKEKDPLVLKQVFIEDEKISSEQINEIVNLTQAVFHARDLVNEPLSYLTANQFSKEIENLGSEAGFMVEVFNKKKIESLKMGGLLAVNKGSIDPPTFNIMEWKPENAKNTKPIVLVGKGIVFDTGGLSLKPTPKSMDFMKSDMGGGAVVAATIYALAINKVPVHVIGLIPATDNRPDGNAYAPGDIITMFDGTTVEIKNTDAEGRLVLADALSYAKKYSPALVIDLATLTGAAEIVAGNHALVGMGNTSQNMEQLKETGSQVYERIIEVPLWEEYAKPLKSPIADLNNLGTREAQSTIAGKFLEHFTDYNWIHLDIAPVSFRFEKDKYLPVGGTGCGTRLLYHFLKKFN